MKEQVVIFDIDGVVCDNRARQIKYVHHEKDSLSDALDFFEFSQTVEGDEPIPAGVNLARFFSKNYRVIWVTARREDNRNLTLKWLQEHVLDDVSQENLFTREIGYSATSFKRETAELLQKDYEILYAVDDDPNYIEAYQSLGIPTMQFTQPGVDCISHTKNRFSTSQ